MDQFGWVNMDWELFDSSKDKRYGPFSESSVIDQIRRNLNPKVMCRRVGEEGWRSLFSHKPFSESFRNARGIEDLSGEVVETSASRQTFEESAPKPTGTSTRRIFLGAVVVVLVGALIGWVRFFREPELTKEDAKAAILRRAFPKGAICRVDSYAFSTEGPRANPGKFYYSKWGKSEDLAQCCAELNAAGLIREYGCDEEKCSFRLGSAGFTFPGMGAYPTFSCGSVAVSVSVLSTEGNRATAFYSVTPSVDEETLRGLKHCRIERPQGASELKQSFLRDDSGTWSSVIEEGSKK